MTRRRSLTFCAFACLLVANSLWAQQPVFRGTVVLVDEYGHESPAVRAQVTMQETGGSDVTDGVGRFRIPLPQAFRPDREITVGVDKQGWAVWEPLEGKTPIPLGPLTIRLLPKGSKKFQTDKFIETFIEDAVKEAKRQVQVADAQKSARPVDLGPLIKDWAAKYGFSPEEVKERIDQWTAEVQAAREDIYKLGLAAFAEHNFRKAGDLFDEAGRNAEKELAALKQQQAKLDAELTRKMEETARDYRKEGDSRYSDYAFAEALAKYEKALSVVERGRKPDLWAGIQLDIGRAAEEIGTRTEGAAVHQYLVQAVAADRAALEIFTREQLPRDWARTQNNLGLTLEEQGLRASGEEGRQLLAQAVTAYRAALEVREQLSQDWAGTQNNLGSALWNQGLRASGEESRQLLAQAVAAYRAALEVRTREQSPREWAATQNNLGIALDDQGTRTGGEEGRQLLAQAVTAYRAALEVRTRKQLPQDWATTQNNLGATLADQGTRTGGEEGRQLLAQAVAAYRAALEVQTREQLPQDWAMTENNLGNALTEQGTRTGVEEGRQLLAQAVTAYRAALEVQSREQLPEQWARTQNNLAKAYVALGEWANAAESLRNFLLVYPDSEETCQALAEVYHELLFDFPAAFDLSQAWLERHPSDISWRGDRAEAALTIGRFADAERWVRELLGDAGMDARLQAALRALEIAALVAQRKMEAVPGELQELVGLVSAQPIDFRVIWSWSGTEHFVQTDERMASARSWLLSLFEALQGRDRDTVVRALQSVVSSFPRISSLA